MNGARGSDEQAGAAAGRPPGLEADAHGRGPDDRSYAVGAVVRRTGLSSHVLRAWERRYRAISPQRTPGGSRRYSEADVRRLQLLRAAVDAGHAISTIAGLSDAAIAELVSAAPAPGRSPVEEALATVESLDAFELERILSVQFSALGPREFAYEVALPLLREIGNRWEAGSLTVAAEHLASATTRSLLGIALRGRVATARETPTLFATPSGERHEFGVLVAALVSLGAGANALYLGPDLPAEDLRHAAQVTGAGTIVLGVVTSAPADTNAYVSELRGSLPQDVEIWIGGTSDSLPPAREGVVPLQTFQQLEQRVIASAGRPEGGGGRPVSGRGPLR